MTLPRMAAMSHQWKLTPPPAVQLARIASWLGIKVKDAEAATPEALATKAREIGMPVMDQLPPDDDIKFLDLDIPLGQGIPSNG